MIGLMTFNENTNIELRTKVKNGIEIFSIETLKASADAIDTVLVASKEGWGYNEIEDLIGQIKELSIKIIYVTDGWKLEEINKCNELEIPLLIRPIKNGDLIELLGEKQVAQSVLDSEHQNLIIANTLFSDQMYEEEVPKEIEVTEIYSDEIYNEPKKLKLIKRKKRYKSKRKDNEEKDVNIIIYILEYFYKLLVLIMGLMISLLENLQSLFITVIILVLVYMITKQNDINSLTELVEFGRNMFNIQIGG